MDGRRNYHHDRIQQAMLIILGNTLKEEIYDPVLKLATFTDIRLTNDYSQATVFVDTYDRNQIDDVVETCKKAQGVFKTALAKQLEIRKIPDLIFERDRSIDQSLEIERLITDIHKK